VFIIVVIFSVAIIAIGAYGISTPSGVLSLARRFASSSGIALGFSLRVVFATALWLSADASATPIAFRVLSILTLIGAIALPVMGVNRLTAFITWWSDLPSWSIRIWLGFALCFGLFTLGSSVLGSPAG